MTLVNEGLKAGDLEGIVSKRFSVDQFKSKMGEDRNIMVLAFSVDSHAAAKDLERFAETGYKEVLDLPQLHSLCLLCVCLWRSRQNVC